MPAGLTHCEQRVAFQGHRKGRDVKCMTMQESDNAARFFALTGGPGSGKSSLIDALHLRDHARSLEAGRQIIQDQMTIGGRALPWDDRILFAELMQVLGDSLVPYSTAGRWARLLRPRRARRTGIPPLVGSTGSAAHAEGG